MYNKVIIVDINESFIVQAEEFDFNPGEPDTIDFGCDISAYPDAESYATVQTVAVPSIAVRMPRFY